MNNNNYRIPSFVIIVFFSMVWAGFFAAQPVSASPSCRTEQFYLQMDASKGVFTMYNCSGASAGTTLQVGALNNALSNTDAAYLGLLKSTDVYMANNEWLVWIDQTVSPGILRGLWPIEKDGYPSQPPWKESKYSTSQAPLRSIVQVQQGFTSLDQPTSNGYKGLHVEIWRESQGSFFYTYPKEAPLTGNSNISISTTQIVSSYATKLVKHLPGSSDDGTTNYVDPVNGSVSELKYYIAYFLSPDSWQIQTALGSSLPTHVRGRNVSIALRQILVSNYGTNVVGW